MDRGSDSILTNPVRMADERPNPDQLLAQVQADEGKSTRGKLKIFFGASPGVGKTYAMLEAARKVAKEGIDVLVGYIEPHARSETQALVLGLDMLARREVDYRGTKLLEFDLEAGLASKPQLILVDEAAHTNAPGSTHTKRWQDIVSLLDTGLNVYTTLNVQHLESLNDVVAQITGVVVRETVPDSFFDNADEIELVDIAPDDLLERLREGKVYMSAQANRAIANFFTKGNLIALRELALQRSAERVATQMDVYREVHAVQRILPARERLLVCVGPSPYAQRLVRATRRIAGYLRAPWVAVYVETPRDARMSADDRARLAQTLQLAEQLGGETATLSGDRLADEVLQYARSRNVTRIVIGKPKQPRWRERLRGPLVYELARKCGDIDVYIISGDAPEETTAAVARPETTTKFGTDYVWSIFVVAVCTGVGWLLKMHGLELTNVAMVYLLGLVGVALRFGRGPSILAAVMGVAAFDFIFVPPRGSFAVSDTQYVLTLAVMLVTALVISTLVARVKFQVESARSRERRTAALYTVSRELAATQNAEQIARIALRHVKEAVDASAVVLLRDGKGELHSAGAATDDFVPTPHDQAVARWVLDHGQIAGRGTNTLPGAKGIYLPLTGARGTVGVLGVVPADGEQQLDLEQIHLLEAIAGLTALAIERANLSEESERIRLDVQTEQLRSALLSAVSHDLRTPLSVITGASSTLLDSRDALSPDTRRELTESILDESERLNRLVANLLDMTRLQAGALKVRKEWHVVEEVVGAALGRMARHLQNHPVATKLAPDLPLAPLDDLLIQQVLLNLLENAVRYTPAGTPLEIGARQEGDWLIVEVADRGPGLPPGDPRRLFDKFHRSPDAPSSVGSGLGLAICRGIVELHGGKIQAVNRSGGGAVFRFTLLLAAPPAGTGAPALADDATADGREATADKAEPEVGGVRR